LSHTALVVGATSDIGRHTVHRLLDQGVRVIATSRSRERLDETYAEQNADTFLPVALDVTDPASIDAAGIQMAAFGSPDIIVVNSGISKDYFILRMNEKRWQAVVDANLTGTFRVVKKWLRPMMKQRWGRIITMSSISALAGNAGQSNYAAAKAGVIGFTLTLAKELAPWKITCNVIAPGLIDTAMTRAMDKDILDTYIQRIPLKRMGRPEEVAAAIAFLCRETSGYITGEVVRIDGGMFTY